jgi:hypothetical protein
MKAFTSAANSGSRSAAYEREELLANQIVQRVFTAELLTYTFGCRALVDPHFMELYWAAVHGLVLLFRLALPRKRLRRVSWKA